LYKATLQSKSQEKETFVSSKRREENRFTERTVRRGLAITRKGRGP